MSRYPDQGNAAYAASNWDPSERSRASNCPIQSSTAGLTFDGSLKRHRESQGLGLQSSLTLKSTIAAIGAVDPLSPMWSQQQGHNPEATYPGASTTHKRAVPSNEHVATTTRNQPYMIQGYQQPAAAGNSDESPELYGVFRQDRTSDPYARHNRHATASAAQVQSHITADVALKQQQQHMLLLQRQQAAAAAQAKQQQLLLAQAQQAQQQQQAALARSAAAAATAGLAGARALYGNYQSMNAGQQQAWDCNAANYSHQLKQQQQLFGLNSQHICLAPDAGLPPGSANHHAPSNHLFDAYVAAAADATKSARLALQQLQDQNSNISSSSRVVSGYAQQASGAAAAHAKGPGKGPVARWSGQLGIINAPGAVPGSAESDANTGGLLECNEDLLSLEALDMYNLQPVPHLQSAATAVQPSTHAHILQRATETRSALGPGPLPGCAQDTRSTNHSDSDYTMSDDDMEDDQLHAMNRHTRSAALGLSVLGSAKATAVTAEEGLASEHTVALQVLGTVAEMRKGAPVLTAAPAYAAAAGAQSVRLRLLISEVSVYTLNGANSQLALDQANKLLGKMTMPDDIDYMPVSSESFLYRAGAAWQFPAFVVCLGSSYLQRMFARLPQLAEAAKATPGFEDYCQYLADTYQRTTPRLLSGEEATSTLATLRSVQFTCLFLALKMADQIHALGLLRFMLTNLSHNGAVVNLQQASDVEARCLDALGWRLGPFFLEDDLSGNDELLWAEAMGHWNYGTDRDSYPEAYE